MTTRNPAPDETATVTIGTVPPASSPAETVSVDESTATATHRATATEPSTAPGHQPPHVLEREPDGRYRIVPPKPEQP